MKTQERIVDGKKYAIIDPIYFDHHHILPYGTISRSGKELKNNSAIKLEYRQKLYILEDEVRYIYNDRIDSPYSIYAYCDYLKALKSLSDIV